LHSTKSPPPIDKVAPRRCRSSITAGARSLRRPCAMPLLADRAAPADLDLLDQGGAKA
jgi:hypothetical protein